MIMISNSVKYEPNQLIQLNAEQNTLNLSSEKNSSNSFLNLNNIKYKLDIADVLKAADGDIIFGNHSQHVIQKASNVYKSKYSNFKENDYNKYKMDANNINLSPSAIESKNSDETSVFLNERKLNIEPNLSFDSKIIDEKITKSIEQETLSSSALNEKFKRIFDSNISANNLIKVLNVKKNNNGINPKKNCNQNLGKYNHILL